MPCAKLRGSGTKNLFCRVCGIEIEGRHGNCSICLTCERKHGKRAGQRPVTAIAFCRVCGTKIEGRHGNANKCLGCADIKNGMQIRCYCPVDLYEAVHATAKDQGMNVSEILRDALRLYLDVT